MPSSVAADNIAEDIIAVVVTDVAVDKCWPTSSAGISGVLSVSKSIFGFKNGSGNNS